MSASGVNIRKRQLARLSAVQALYQMDLIESKSKLVVREFKEYWFENAATAGKITANKQFFELLVMGVVAEQDAVDAAIRAKLSKTRRLSRMDVILRAIMRCGTYEILRVFDVPAIVTIDQYVSLTSDFYEGKEPSFVNAALDKLAREHRPAEFGIPAPIAG
ncbi:MAG: transcription antitermination factor NusB [Robiginitomaculum sp.]